MSEDKVKLVIVMRSNFPDGKGGTFRPRLGKMIAQGAHAASAFLLEKLQRDPYWTATQSEWLRSGTTKICVRAETEQELLDIFQQAKDAKLPVHLITDAGLTEFKEPTVTCLAIGPARASEIDKITGQLKLL
jgi:PTH2 family peptidyl-tRNA hydrolase